MGARYGSKAAYEEAKRVRNMTEEDRTKQRNRERLDDEEMMTVSLFIAAAMAGGKKAKDAIGEADLVMAELRKRYT